MFDMLVGWMVDVLCAMRIRDGMTADMIVVAVGLCGL